MKILKFYSPTCMPCRIVGGFLEKLENIEVVSIDATEDLSKVDAYEICTTPTLIFLNEEDKEVGRIEGMTTLKNIQEMLSK